MLLYLLGTILAGFGQKQASSENVNVKILNLKCTRWPNAPFNKLNVTSGACALNC